MSDLPYFNFWGRDYLAKTRHLSWEEHGVYLLLLMLQWDTPGCRILQNDAWIMRKMGADQERFDRVVHVILEEFFPIDGGYYVNRRLRDEYDRALALSKAGSKAGKKSGESRRKRPPHPKSLKEEDSPPNDRSTIVQRSFNQPEPDSDSDPYTEVKRVVLGHASTREERIAAQGQLRSLTPQIYAVCAEAAGDRVDDTRPKVHDVSEIIRLLAPIEGEPCSLDDVVSAISIAADQKRRSAQLIASWAYVVPIAVRNRDIRLNPLPDVETTRAPETSFDGSNNIRPHRRGYRDYNADAAAVLEQLNRGTGAPVSPGADAGGAGIIDGTVVRRT